jgi:hypothetical protein
MEPALTHRSAPRPSDPRIGRGIGAVGVVLLCLVFFSLGDNPMFTDASNAEILRWVHGHETELYVGGYLEALAMLLNAVVLGALAWRARLAGTARLVVWGLIGASLAIDMVNTGAQYGLAKAVDRGLGDGTLLGLFTFIEQLTFTDGVTWGLVIGVVSVAALRTRTLPRPVCLLGVAVGLVHVLGIPAQLVATQTPEGANGPISTVLLMLWWLAAALSLLIRPGQPADAADHGADGTDGTDGSGTPGRRTAALAG